MTDSDDTLARRYRELAREEPRAALDEAILAASRRALARPSASRRWAAPVSIAAVLVLAFGITLEMQREEPGVESPATDTLRAPLPEPSPPAKDEAAPSRTEAYTGAPAPKPAAPARGSTPAPSDAPALPAPYAARERPAQPAVAKEAPAASAEKKRVMPVESPAPFPGTSARSNLAPAQPATPAAAAPPAAAARADAAPAAAPQSTAGVAPRLKAEAADAAQPLARAAIAPGDLERELERIAKLRDGGRNADADKALEDFRRDHPAYRIPDAMWERVKPR
jgi:hypothetical protein